MRKPKVTVGVCVRNCENTIREAIESIRNQDYPHELIEVIFVDDGSTDKTLLLIKEYASSLDLKVKIFHHKWKGIGYSRNVVVKNAVGDFIVWVDGDIIISSEYIRKLVEFMENNPKVGIAKGQQSLNDSVTILGALEAYSRAASRMVDYRHEKAKFKSLGTGGAIYRAKIFSDTGIFDESMRGYYEDFDLELRVRAFGWSLDTVNVEFSDYERKKVDIKVIWERYWRRGYFAHYFSHKNEGAVKIYKMFPLIAVVAGLLDAVKIYSLIGKKIVFSLPLLFFFKAVAWNMGFLASHLINYEPNSRDMSG
ncbi:MAG: glycosyltransferase [Candidatus Bathyarchaeota archaeon]|nr:glycosyltransferase [Candidatus Bathyarchaeota archaeon]